MSFCREWTAEPATSEHGIERRRRGRRAGGRAEWRVHGGLLLPLHWSRGRIAPVSHPVGLLLAAHPAPLTGGLAWFVIDPVDRIGLIVWYVPLRPYRYRYRAYR